MAHKKICLFGSSCNPPTGDGGHRSLVKYFAEKFEEVWVLPVFKHAFATKRDLAEFNDRINMAKLNFESVAANVKVLRLEEEVVTEALNKAMAEGIDPSTFTVGSYDLLNAIKAKSPEYDISWIMGGDTFNDLRAGKWKNSELIPQMVHIQLVLRPGVELQYEIPEGITKHVLDDTTDVSSTKVRSSNNPDELKQWLHPDVLKYIQDHKMYGFKDAELAAQAK
jgi:nicotinate (nicotinamide) nucleotide adenylyltransferase|eukprot:CAMPEP_0174286530 /NCGR_PEP_ID=MMETSP0809-20121228/12329_1 /TAXON_ID=73025 ORGANISM="Eutreptiella gymnastica-like, Strain CCMP1594" /NCGR_SAMPLE_ID=MMETSP0809 /ASSEMBLY_ACC=CAM_ASM_000658 /LENGTH=222 /DNA_ID=CAMNT_0015382653 /DNA_START=23 /DNA_END=691 /DNA_ORIENTATION=+